MKQLRHKLISSEKKSRANREITAPQVRLVDENGQQVGVVSIAEALERAQSVNLDLVEVSPNAAPPVCKILDFGKYRYQYRKRHQQKPKSRQQLKEIKFRPTTDIGDYQIKQRKIIKFLESGIKVKITVRFRGREMMHQQLGLELLKRLEEDLREYGSVDKMPALEGRQLSMMLTPVK